MLSSVFHIGKRPYGVVAIGARRAFAALPRPATNLRRRTVAKAGSTHGRPANQPWQVAADRDLAQERAAHRALDDPPAHSVRRYHTTLARRESAGLLAFSVTASLSVAHLAVYQGRPWAIAALLVIPLGMVVMRHPGRLAASIAIGSLVLMLGYGGTNGADQTMLGRTALQSVLAAETPYQVYDFGQWSNPYPYGPLAMLTALLWPFLEILAALALLGVLAHARAWITSGFLAGFPPFVYLALSGVNDYSQALLTVAALLLLRTKPAYGFAVLAIATAIKPYSAAWFLPALGYAGWSAAWFIGISALLWSPLLLWGLDSYVSMTQLASSYIGFPAVRLLSIPLGIAALLAKTWSGVLLTGSGIFASVLLFGSWASLGYLVVLVPVIGLALETTIAAPTSNATGQRRVFGRDRSVGASLP